MTHDLLCQGSSSPSTGAARNVQRIGRSYSGPVVSVAYQYIKHFRQIMDECTFEMPLKMVRSS